MRAFGETEPNDLQKALVDEALYLRGRIVASYAQVEFLLADLVVKLDLRFRYRIDDRIKAVKHIADRYGYEPYREEHLRSTTAIRRATSFHGARFPKPDDGSEWRPSILRYQREGKGKFNAER